MIRFQADADLNFTIVAGVLRREPALDFQDAHDGGIVGLADPEVLEVAAEQNRILVSHDVRTMPSHFADFLLERDSPGVLLIPQHLPISTAIEELVLIWSATEPTDWANRLCRLPL